MSRVLRCIVSRTYRGCRDRSDMPLSGGTQARRVASGLYDGEIGASTAI